jgi:hypothetical protein
MLMDIDACVTTRTDLVNAADVATSVLAKGVNLEVAAKHLLHSLSVGDRKTAVFAFDVLNMQCGNRLPTPTFVNTGACKPSIDCSNLTYVDKVKIAADLIGNAEPLRAQATDSMGRMTLKCIQAGQGSGALCSVFYMIYPLGK